MEPTSGKLGYSRYDHEPKSPVNNCELIKEKFINGIKVFFFEGQIFKDLYDVVRYVFFRSTMEELIERTELTEYSEYEVVVVEDENMEGIHQKIHDIQHQILLLRHEKRIKRNSKLAKIKKCKMDILDNHKMILDLNDSTSTREGVDEVLVSLVKMMTTSGNSFNVEYLMGQSASTDYLYCDHHDSKGEKDAIYERIKELKETIVKNQKKLDKIPKEGKVLKKLKRQLMKAKSDFYDSYESSVGRR